MILFISLRNCEEFYGKSSINFNTHALLYVVDNVYKSGPLSSTSAFPYENGIFMLKQKLTSPKGALIQMSKRLIQKTILETELLSTSDDKPSRFCKNILRNHLILKETGLKTNSGVILLTEDNNLNKNIKQVLNNNFVDIRLEDVKVFNKAVYKNVMCTLLLVIKNKQKLMTDFLKV